MVTRTCTQIFDCFNNFIGTYCPKGVGHERDSRSHAGWCWEIHVYMRFRFSTNPSSLVYFLSILYLIHSFSISASQFVSVSTPATTPEFHRSTSASAVFLSIHWTLHSVPDWPKHGWTKVNHPTVFLWSAVIYSSLQVGFGSIKQTNKLYSRLTTCSGLNNARLSKARLVLILDWLLTKPARLTQD